MHKLKSGAVRKAQEAYRRRDPETDPTANEITKEESRRNRQTPTENMALPFSVYMIEEV